MSLLVASHLRLVQSLQCQKRRGNVRDKTMTREEIKRRVELYSALADGKTIQVQNPNGGEWFDVKIGTLRSISEELNYRIKPEPKYRPFKSQEECWNEMLKHQPFSFVVNKDSVDYFSICRVFKDEKGISRITFISNPYSGWDMEIVFDRFNFADGTPFGIKEE